MATEVMTTETVVKTDSSAENLKAILSSLTEQSTQIKGLMNTVRAVIKDVERQTKELEKLRNKRSRTKTERAANALPSGITKPVAISDELAMFLCVKPGTLVPRNEVTKGVSAFVRQNELSDPTNKQKFVLDNRDAAKKLRTLLGNPSEDVTYFNLQRYLKHHYLPMPETEKEPATPKVKKSSTPAPTPEPVVSTPVPEISEAPKKKKVIMKKKELVEEV
jgi:chromatin remodeling complex protein RSC6